MAANITSSPFFFIHPNSNPIKKTSKSVLMFANKDTPNTSSSLIRVGSPIKIQKVFEDKSRGIVCYLDDNGEITCEGYDEGPRLHQPSSKYLCYSRGNQEIVDLLERSLLQITDGGNFN
ncbi:hypothetical protein R6Q59_021350 [Mikania micrantha]|uniref:Uncharacterized protein n=1 Tax=Mikania micrantha TaxID=192012 RepID=A0A5N6PMA8_9ASTR|nr:hypothetical protein E3N88_05637 [Mikania micrantha]KAD6794830.1 hypothetical protein E3N88_05726 [Mikania micrantha]